MRTFMSNSFAGCEPDLEPLRRTIGSPGGRGKWDAEEYLPRSDEAAFKFVTAG
jgi:hypothetical protein